MAQKSLLIKISLFLLILSIGSASAAPFQPASLFSKFHTNSQFATEMDLGLRNNLPITYLKLRQIHPADSDYDREELAVEMDALVSNPFDSQQINVQVRFTSPDGKMTSIAAFWYQDYDPYTLQPKGDPEFRVRFTPDMPGEWTAQAYLPWNSLKSKSVKFSVKPDQQSKGFIRVNPQNPRYLAFDDGSLYFPIGLNMAWSRGEVLSDYRNWMDQLSQNGGNAIRVWMASWSFGLEWKDTGLGNFTQRLRQAWLLDQIFDMAQERGIYITLTLINHGAFSTVADSEWQDNPYNAILGGPCQTPQDFVIDPLARQYFKQRLRYITSRWAYSPNLMAWEWWNEVDWTPINDVQLLPWLQEMGDFLSQADPYQHLVTNSYKLGDRSNLWSLPGISIAQVHDYSGADPAVNFPVYYSHLTAQAGDKPALVGEYGNPSLQTDQKLDQAGLHLHNGLWAAPFNGFAGVAMYWWWDQFIDPTQLWPQYRAIAQFLQDENLASLTPGKARVHPNRANALTLSNSHHALVWIRNQDANIAAVKVAYSAALVFNLVGPDWLYQPLELSGLTLTLDGLDDGPYQVDWYSPQTALWLKESLVEVSEGKLRLLLPEFTNDLALKILPSP